MTELEAYKNLVDCCFTIHTNMNDTFHWATSDVGEIDAGDIPKIIPIYMELGFDTLVAYEAILRGYDPEPSMISHWKDKGANFYRAKSLLQPLADAGTIMWERWDALQKAKKSETI